MNYINAITQSTVRQPRAIVRLNGVAVPGWVSWDVHSNSFFEADTFSIEFALSAMPKQYGVSWWGAQTEILVEILAGFPQDPQKLNASELASQILGLVDTIEFDPAANTLHVGGRDLTGLLIDSKTPKNWLNLTPAQIVAEIASRHSLVPVVVDGPKSRKAGTTYMLDYTKLNTSQSDWDVMADLARQVGFDAYVRGRELHFEPQPQLTDPPYLLQWQPGDVPMSNAIHLGFERNMAVARGVTVVVHSSQLKTKQTLVARYPKGSPNGLKQSPAVLVRGGHIYRFTASNKDQGQIDQMAEARYAEIVAHELKLDACLPADNLLTTRNVIKVVGTKSAWDATYRAESITRRMGVDDGYSMDVPAKAYNPATAPAAEELAPA